MFAVMAVMSALDMSEVIGSAEVVVSNIVRSERRCILSKWTYERGEEYR
jgi:hypothetical protein